MSFQEENEKYFNGEDKDRHYNDLRWIIIVLEIIVGIGIFGTFILFCISLSINIYYVIGYFIALLSEISSLVFLFFINKMNEQVNSITKYLEKYNLVEEKDYNKREMNLIKKIEKLEEEVKELKNREKDEV